METLQNLITPEVRRIADERADSMGLSQYTRLRINGEASDIVILTSATGIFFYYSPDPIKTELFDTEYVYLNWKQLAQ